MKYVFALFLICIGIMVRGAVIDVNSYETAFGRITSIHRQCQLLSGGYDTCSTSALREYRGRLVGSANIQVSYTSPITGKERQDTFAIDAKEKDFYSLQQNDVIRIDVHKQNKGEIRFIDRPEPR